MVELFQLLKRAGMLATLLIVVLFTCFWPGKIQGRIFAQTLHCTDQEMVFCYVFWQVIFLENSKEPKKT